MDMKLGLEAERQIIIKQRNKLKALLCEHEVKSDGTRHIMLMSKLIQTVKEHLWHLDPRGRDENK
jgi:hypothetical protein